MESRGGSATVPGRSTATPGRPSAGSTGQSSVFHSTRKAGIGRPMFLSSRSPRAWSEALSRPFTASRTARETTMPPGGASVSSRAATFTSSP